MGVWYSDLSRAARRSTQEHPQKEVSRAAKDALQVRSEKSGGSALLSTQFCLHFRGQLRHKLCVVRTSRQKTYRIVEYLLSRDSISTRCRGQRHVLDCRVNVGRQDRHGVCLLYTS